MNLTINTVQRVFRTVLLGGCVSGAGLLCMSAMQAVAPTSSGGTPTGQAPVTPTDAAEALSDAKEAFRELNAPWEGTLNEGLAEARRLTAEEQFPEALELLDRVLSPTHYLFWRTRLHEGLVARAQGNDWLEPIAELLDPAIELVDPLAELLGLTGWPKELRGEVHFARGVVGLHAGDVETADQAFGAAREMAGVDGLREDAVYDLGVLYLLVGETLREQLKSEDPAAGGAPMPQAGVPVAGGPIPGPGGTEEPPDPIQVARAAYMRSRQHLVERLRLDWRDADTRANVELIQRRLRELDEMEKEQEEQEQEQQQEDQQSDDEQEQNEDQESEESEEPKDEEQEPEDQENQEPEEQEEPSESEDEPQEAPPEELQEIHLTREEMMRLLEKLEEIEEEKEQVQEQLYRKRRVPVKRDW